MKTLIGYYPGCALHGSSNDYDQSLQACFGEFDVRLSEIEDWICCGATAAHAVNPLLSKSLSARNLAIAEQGGFEDLLAPCPLCSMALNKARQEVTGSEETRKKLSEIVELPIKGQVRVLNTLQVFEKIGPEAIRSRVTRPLEEFRAACYYGCLLTRPPKVCQFDDCEHPRSMEAIVEAVGATTVRWNYATECCGAGMTLAREETVIELTARILKDAALHGANCLVAACPMCHVNLDMKQEDVRREYPDLPALPVYYISDLVGLAVGLTETKLGVDKHFVTQPPAREAAPAETR